MTTIHDLLQRKGNQVFTVAKGETLAKAVGLLNKHHVGALIVTTDGEKPIGIVSERDVMHFLSRNGGDLGGVYVENIMTPEDRMVVITPKDDLDYAMGVMTKNRIRHLPVVNNGRLVGIVSIGDAIKSLLKQKTVENKMLQDYISSVYPA